MVQRQINLRYPGRCRVCGRDLVIGTTVLWDPDTKMMTCERCRTDLQDHAEPEPAAPPAAPAARRSLPGRTTAPIVRSPWQQLVDYHLLAVTRAATIEPVLLGNRRLWAALTLVREDLITGRADELPLVPALRSLFADLEPGESVFYGWPVLVVPDLSGQLRVAPLVITELEPPGPDATQVVPRDDAPALNAAILAENYFPADALDAVSTRTAAGAVFGDAAATRSMVAEVVETLGFRSGTINPDALIPRVGDRAGVYNSAVAFRGLSNPATLALIRDLTALRSRDDWQQTAARWLLAAPHAAGWVPTAAAVPPDGPPKPPFAVQGLQLNDSQEQAVVAALQDELTVVTGPPGTGKSQLVGAVVVNEWFAGRTVLVASTNNGAVDVAVRRCADVDRALLIRTGKRELRDALPETLRGLTERVPETGPSPEIVGRQLDVAAEQRHSVLERLTARTAAEAELAQLIIDLEHRRATIWGSPGRSPVHADLLRIGRRADRVHRARLFAALRERRLLSAAGVRRTGVVANDLVGWATDEARAAELAGRLDGLGPADPDADRGELSASADAWSEAGTTGLRALVQHRLQTGRAALSQLANLRKFAPASRAAAIVRTLPFTSGWACTALSVEPNFPLQAGLFDLLVIDEASQCSVADILPLAYRARRVLVVGDPNQLTPVVTLGAATVARLARSVGSTPEAMRVARVSVADDSAFTAYASRGPSRQHLLDEHYRCHPEIARFINEVFYGGSLRVLTAVDPSTPLRGLSVIDVPGETQRGEKGGAFNRAEASAIVAWVLDHQLSSGALGIVTPFKSQGELVRKMLLAELGGQEFEERDITIGTAHRFQGDERDIVLFSTVLAKDARDGTARWVEKQRNLVNVAVSRARRALVVFADTAALQRHPVPTLQLLVAMAGGRREAAADVLVESPDLHSESERRLFLALSELGIPVRTKPIVEGYELDFAIDTASGSVDLEIDGIHHTDARGRQRRQDLARDQVLAGLGWTVIRVPAWRCLADAADTARQIADQLNGLPRRR